MMLSGWSWYLLSSHTASYRSRSAPKGVWERAWLDVPDRSTETAKSPLLRTLCWSASARGLSVK